MSDEWVKMAKVLSRVLNRADCGDLFNLTCLYDDTYPEPAPLPYWATPDLIARLGVYIAVDGQFFTVPAVDAGRREYAAHRAKATERMRRHRDADVTRHNPVTDASQTRHLLARDEDEDEDVETTRTRVAIAPRDVSSTREPSPIETGYGTVVRYAERLTGRPYVIPSSATRFGEQVTDWVGRFGDERVCSAFDRVAAALPPGNGPPTIKQLMFGADDILTPPVRGLNRPPTDDDEIADVKAETRRRMAANG